MSGRFISAFTVLAVLVATGCSSGGRESASTTTSRATDTSMPHEAATTTVIEATPSSTSASTVPVAAPTTPAGEIAIRATVAATFASARVITLAEPVSGYTDVAFTAETRYRRAGGQAAALADLTPGTAVEVRGQRGSETTLLAREVVVL